MGNYHRTRRNFLQDAAKAGLAFTAGGIVPEAFSACTPARVLTVATKDPIGFDQTPLPYSYTALEPVIDATTMELHYSKHAAAYSKNLKEAVAAEAKNNESLETLLSTVSKYSAKLRNNAGGHYNHELFWKLMKPAGEGRPTGSLLTALEGNFGSFEAFRTQFSDAAKTRFGSGWAWLYATSDRKLKIASTPNQDNPLMDVSDVKGFPILGLDVWEHAYYLKYQNRRAEYVDNWWKVINWETAQNRFDTAWG
ncbi:MAG TPA: superoxide dismutase [Flavitalea sp.]|nr:superoxide dismutase [Flavitalea sp.]